MRSDGVLPDLRRVGVGSTDEPTRGSIDDQRPARHRRAAREIDLPDVRRRSSARDAARELVHHRVFSLCTQVRGGGDGAGRRSPSANAEATTEHAADKDCYLKVWRDLEGRLEERTPRGPWVCFGIGEAAGLLPAYAPRTWPRVERCVADNPEHDAFGTLPVDEYRRMATPTTLLLGVRPPSQTRLRRAFADGHVPITWHDLVAS